MANSSYMQHKLPAPEDSPVNGHAEDDAAPPRPSPSRGAPCGNLGGMSMICR